MQAWFIYLKQGESIEKVLGPMKKKLAIDLAKSLDCTSNANQHYFASNKILVTLTKAELALVDAIVSL